MHTHPHQISIEILSEHGLFGFLIFLFILIIFIKQNILIVLKKKGYLAHMSIFSYFNKFYTYPS